VCFDARKKAGNTIVVSIQTFGQKINLHPHLHCLVTEGGENVEGRFHHLASFQDSLLAEFFSREVFSLLLREELISEALVDKIAGWRHSGFSVHSKVKVESKSEAEVVGQYMIRPLLSLKRLSLDETTGRLRYQHLRDGSEESMDYLEFIARINSHIPDKGQVMIRYYGLYSNAHRGKMRKTDTNPLCPLIIEDEDPFIPASSGILRWRCIINSLFFAQQIVINNKHCTYKKRYSHHD